MHSRSGYAVHYLVSPDPSMTSEGHNSRSMSHNGPSQSRSGPKGCSKFSSSEQLPSGRRGQDLGPCADRASGALPSALSSTASVCFTNTPRQNDAFTVSIVTGAL